MGLVGHCVIRMTTTKAFSEDVSPVKLYYGMLLYHYKYPIHTHYFLC